jgi:hypothetical protein
MMFNIGQKVVCVFHMPPSQRREWAIYAERGEIYTVREIYTTSRGKVNLLLREIINEPRMSEDGFMEWGFKADAFRPIVEKKTDAGMAILKEILERETISDRAPART